jgi:hypothetical protein
MSGQSIISGANAFNRTIYTAHTLVADEEAAGHEAWRIATGRRSAYTNYYTSLTANAQRLITLTCDRERAFDYFVLDRGHNLTRIILERSYDNFASSPITVFDVTLPTASGTGSLDDAFGVVSEELAWHIRFTKISAPYWRLKIPALGAGIRPKIVGAHLSMSFAFDAWRPHSPDLTELGGEMSESDAGWQVVANAFNRRTDTLRIQLPDLFAYEIAINAFRHYNLRRPTWYVPNEDNAQNALCIVRPLGVAGLGRMADWFPQKGELPFLEHEALNG